MPIRFTTRGRRVCRPARLGRPGAAHLLTAAAVGLALLGGQHGLPDRLKVASTSRDDARVQSQGCLPDGSGLLKVSLSGAVPYSIEWHNDDMECGGQGGNVQFGGVPAGAGSQVDLTFKIQVEEGATGTDLPASVGIMDRASERYFQTSEEGGCTVDVTEQSLIDENPAFRRYRLAAKGRCDKPSVQYSPGPGAGVSEITVGDFELVGLAVWMGPRM